MKQAARNRKILSMVLLAGLLPWLASLGEFFIFAGRRQTNLLHWCLWHGLWLMSYGILLIGAVTAMRKGQQRITDQAAQLEKKVELNEAELQKEISERTRAEQALREAHQRLNFHLQNSPLAVISFDAELRVIEWSDGARRIFGWEAPDVVGKRMWEIPWICEEDRKKVEHISAALISGEMRRNVSPNRNLRKDGSVIWCEWHNSSLKDASGKMQSIQSLVLDVTERKQTEAALDETVRRLGLLADTAGELLRNREAPAIVDSLCRKVMAELDCQVFFNYLAQPGATTLRLNACAGISAEEAGQIEFLNYGEGVCGTVAQDGCCVVAEHISASQDTKVQIVRRFGVKAYTCHPLLGRKGRVLGTLSFGSRTRDTFSAKDLTLVSAVANNVAVAISRLESEQALRQSEQRLVMALKAGRSGAFERELRSDMAIWSEELLALYGLKAEEFNGSLGNWTECIHEEDRDATLLAYKRALKTGEFVTEFRIRRRNDGEVRWMHARAVVTYDDGGVPLRMIGIHTDITERKLADQALRQSEEQLRLASDAAGFGTYTFTAEPNRMEWSPQLKQMFGMNACARIHTKEAMRRIHPEDRAQVRRKLKESWNPVGTGDFEDEHRIVRTDGMVRWFYVKGRTEFANGKPMRAYGAVLDITDRKQAQTELERLVDERTAKLQEMVGELQHFSYTITHDMRAPLRAMRGYAELLETEGLACASQDQKHYLHRIMVSAERMDLLIIDALNYSRAVLDQLPLAPVDLHKLLLGMLNSYPELQSANPYIQLEDNLPIVMGNEAGLTQCFSNLLGNAVKFVEPGKHPSVRIRSELRDGWVRIWVEDQGIGIAPSMMHRIFDMFSRGQNTHEGTGIGLALVRKVVNRMGGRVGVESELGKGSRFWVELMAEKKTGHPA